MLKENQGNIYLENVELGTSRTGLQHTRELCNKYENKFKTDRSLGTICVHLF